MHIRVGGGVELEVAFFVDLLVASYPGTWCVTVQHQALHTLLAMRWDSGISIV